MSQMLLPATGTFDCPVCAARAERDEAVARADSAEASLALEKAAMRANWKAALELWLHGSEGKGNCFVNWMEEFEAQQPAPEPPAEEDIAVLAQTDIVEDTADAVAYAWRFMPKPEPTAEATYRSPRTRDAVAADQVANAFGNFTGQLPEAAGLGPTAEELRDPEPCDDGDPAIPEAVAELDRRCSGEGDATVTRAEMEALGERLTAIEEGRRASPLQVMAIKKCIEARDCPTRAEVENLAIRLTALEKTGAWTSEQVEAIARQVVARNWPDIAAEVLECLIYERDNASAGSDYVATMAQCLRNKGNLLRLREGAPGGGQDGASS